MTIYSDLNILSLASLPALTFNALPNPPNTNTQPACIKVRDSFQIFSSSTREVNNYVEFTCNGQTAMIATLGKFEPNLDNPLRIDFDHYHTFVNALDPRGVKGAKGNAFLEHHETVELREALNLNPDQRLKKDLIAKAWVDISYIDESADLRVVRFGSRFYILQRV